MRTSSRIPALSVLLVSAALVLAGCGGADGGEGSGNGAGAPTSTGARSSAAEAVPSATDGVPSPDAGEQAILLGALSAVDPGLALDDSSAVQNAVALCVALRGGDDAATAVPDTFPDVELDASQQQAVVAAVTSGFCPLTGASASASPTAT